MGRPGDEAVLNGIRSFRGWWVANGAVWWKPYNKPRDWDLLSQPARIPPHWR
ncbi:hypothetical protein AB0G74_19975 [Streptomyces sp. NPDC020875]|uniref:hypothetical protein n=1 Tax=Streptomyces sp. NPDC020875 TaxID=3154898 RepID=UPI0033C3EF49